MNESELCLYINKYWFPVDVNWTGLKTNIIQHPPPIHTYFICTFSRLPLFLIKNLKIDLGHCTFIVISLNYNSIIYQETLNNIQNSVFDFIIFQIQLIITTSQSYGRKQMRHHLEGASTATSSPQVLIRGQLYIHAPVSFIPNPQGKYCFTAWAPTDL